MIRQRAAERNAAHEALRRHDALQTFPAITAEWISPSVGKTLLAHGAEGREDEVQQCRHPGPPMRLDGTGLSYAREVFQLRHDGQRSNHEGWVAPHATQW